MEPLVECWTDWYEQLDDNSSKRNVNDALVDYRLTDHHPKNNPQPLIPLAIWDKRFSPITRLCML